MIISFKVKHILIQPVLRESGTASDGYLAIRQIHFANFPHSICNASLTPCFIFAFFLQGAIYDTKVADPAE